MIGAGQVERFGPDELRDARQGQAASCISWVQDPVVGLPPIGVARTIGPEPKPQFQVQGYSLVLIGEEDRHQQRVASFLSDLGAGPNGMKSPPNAL